MSIYNKNLYMETMGASMGCMTIGNEIVETEGPEDLEKYFKSTQKGVLDQSRLVAGKIIRMKDKQAKTPQTNELKFRKISSRR